MIADPSTPVTQPLLSAEDRTLAALWDATPEALPPADRWQLVERAAVVLARDARREIIGRILLAPLTIGLALAIGYAMTNITALAAAAAIALLVVLAAWAIFIAEWRRA